MEKINPFFKKFLSFYTPIWKPFFLTILSASILIGLGNWQIQRLDWKKRLISHTKQIWVSPCLKEKELSTFLYKLLRNPDQFSSVSNRCYTVEGEFIFSTNLLLQSKQFTQKNKGIRRFLTEHTLSLYGAEVMTLFKINESGEYIWINRGWTPLPNKAPLIKDEESPFQKISFYLKASPKPSLFSHLLPKNIPNLNIWYTPELSQMSKSSQIPQTISFAYGVQILKDAPKDLPIKFPIPELDIREMPNNHLTYAFIWYSLAACSLLIYGIYHRRQRLQERKHLP